MNSIIESLARALGFADVRMTSARLNEEAFSHYSAWVERGRAGSMAYMTRDPERRRHVEALLPGARSVICLAVNYQRLQRLKRPQTGGQVARYAYGRDYHKIIEKMLEQLVAALKDSFPEEKWKSYVDTGAILERGYAEQAGLGYIGKNTNLIHPRLGSWIFLAEVLTTLDTSNEALYSESSHVHPTDTCGHCRLCLDICPTGALVGPNELDARRCISYLTIENRGPIPVELRPLIGDWLYGCDLCQEVCPKNARISGEPLETLQAQKIGGDFQLLEEILALRTDGAFNERFAGSAMRRAKREGLVRNACVVAANVGARELLPLLKTLSQNDPSELVREHAEWAVNHLEK